MRESDRHLTAWTVRELSRIGQVPVLVLLDGVAVVSSLRGLADALDYDPLELGGWSLPAIGEA